LITAEVEARRASEARAAAREAELQSLLDEAPTMEFVERVLTIADSATQNCKKAIEMGYRWKAAGEGFQRLHQELLDACGA
jgi:hypothetical protein